MNLICLKDKKAIGRTWTSFCGEAIKGQNAIGFVNGSETIAIDFDDADLAEEYKLKLWDKTPLVETASGKIHSYSASDKVITHTFNYYSDGHRAGEYRTGHSYQGFVNYMGLEQLTFSNNYKLLNCSIDDFQSLQPFNLSYYPFLTETYTNTLTTTLTPTDKNKPFNLVHTFQVLEVSEFLPTAFRQNHDLMMKLVNRVYQTGNWENRQTVFQEWVFLNKFKRHSDLAYMREFEAIVRYFDPSRLFSLETCFQEEKQIHSTQTFKSQQDKVNHIIECMVNKLGQRGDFFLSTKFRWYSADNEYVHQPILDDRIHPQQVKRALDKLIREGKIVKVSSAFSWSENKAVWLSDRGKRLKAATYRLVKTIEEDG